MAEKSDGIFSFISWIYIWKNQLNLSLLNFNLQLYKPFFCNDWYCRPFFDAKRIVEILWKWKLFTKQSYNKRIKGKKVVKMKGSNNDIWTMRESNWFWSLIKRQLNLECLRYSLRWLPNLFTSVLSRPIISFKWVYKSFERSITLIRTRI